MSYGFPVRITGQDDALRIDTDPAIRPTWFGFYIDSNGTGTTIPRKGEAWRLFALSLLVSTDATVVAREFYININGGGFTTPLPAICRIFPQQAVSASQTASFSWGIGASDVVTTKASFPWEVHALPPIDIYSDMGIQVGVTGLQAGDSWRLNIYGQRYAANR